MRFSSVKTFPLVTFLFALLPIFWNSSALAQDLSNVAKEQKGVVVQIVVQSESGTSLGSGFWLDDSGDVATCYHVVNVNNIKNIIVRSAIDSLFDLKHDNQIYSNWENYPANIAFTDPVHDVAVIHVITNPFKNNHRPLVQIGPVGLSAHYKVSTLQPDVPAPGERILIAGYPLGSPYLVFQGGTIASMASINDVPKILVSSVANHGNSGGPVFNEKSQVIGLLEGELSGSDKERTGIEEVVPVLYLPHPKN